jgi:cytochrome c biogenesis protein CcmG/thiol:disulfide interchange protein DsbE
MSRLKLYLPLALFALLAGLLYRGLNNDPTELPSALIGQPFPASCCV